MRSLPRTPLVGLAVVALVTASGGAAMAAGGGSNGRTLSGSIPSWANAAHRAGAADGSQTVDFRVYLDNRDQAGAEKYATAVSTKGNALYGKFLTPQQYRSKFSPTDTSVATVKSWLRDQGFAIGTVPANNKYVEATGTVAQAAKAFDTSFASYRYDGANLRSNATPLTVPSSLSQVEAVVGLDESADLVHTDAPKQCAAARRLQQRRADVDLLGREVRRRESDTARRHDPAAAAARRSVLRTEGLRRRPAPGRLRPDPYPQDRATTVGASRSRSSTPTRRRPSSATSTSTSTSSTRPPRTRRPSS